MVKMGTVVAGIIVVGAAVAAYFIFKNLGQSPGSGPDTLSSALGLGGQGSSGNFASGGSSISETFTYSPNVNYSTSQTRIVNTYRFDPKTGLFNFG